jgi:hypothetical protein
MLTDVPNDVLFSIIPYLRGAEEVVTFANMMSISYLDSIRISVETRNATLQSKIESLESMIKNYPPAGYTPRYLRPEYALRPQIEEGKKKFKQFICDCVDYFQSQKAKIPDNVELLEIVRMLHSYHPLSYENIRIHSSITPHPLILDFMDEVTPSTLIVSNSFFIYLCKTDIHVDVLRRIVMNPHFIHEYEPIFMNNFSKFYNIPEKFFNTMLETKCFHFQPHYLPLFQYIVRKKYYINSITYMIMLEDFDLMQGISILIAENQNNIIRWILTNPTIYNSSRFDWGWGDSSIFQHIHHNHDLLPFISHILTSKNPPTSSLFYDRIYDLIIYILNMDDVSILKDKNDRLLLVKYQFLKMTMDYMVTKQRRIFSRNLRKKFMKFQNDFIMYATEYGIKMIEQQCRHSSQNYHNNEDYYYDDRDDSHYDEYDQYDQDDDYYDPDDD